MEIIKLLLGTIALLTVISGMVVFLGSSKDNKIRSFLYFLATISSAIWTASIAYVYLASPGHDQYIDIFIKLGLTSIMWADMFLLGYIAWKVKYGRALTAIFAVIFAVISSIIFLAPEMMYGQIILKNNGSGFETKNGPLGLIYTLSLIAFAVALCYSSIEDHLRARKQNKKNGSLAVLAGFTIADAVVLVANLILPMNGQWSYTWLGPLSLSILIIMLYYVILRYRDISISSFGLRLFSYIVVVSSFAIVYMVIFSIIFSAMFRGATPSTEVIILNFVMASILIAFLPAINEIRSSIDSLISGRNVNLPKLAKKIANLGAKRRDYGHIAALLGEYIRAEYVGLIVNGKYYGPNYPAKPIGAIDALDRLPAPENGIWLEPGKDQSVAQINVSKIAALRNSRGEMIGKILIGKAQSGKDFSPLDVAEIETVTNLLSTVINYRG